MEHLEQSKPQRQEVERWLPGSPRRKGWGVSAYGYGISVWEDEKFPEIDKVVVAAQHGECT